MREPYISCLLAILLFYGIYVWCGKNDTTILDNSEIECVKIEYQYTPTIFRRISCDFAKNTKEVIDYMENDTIKDTSSLQHEKELREFLKSVVIPDCKENGANVKQNSDDQKIVWSIRIRTKNSTISRFNIEKQDTPEYWDELLQIVENS